MSASEIWTVLKHVDDIVVYSDTWTDHISRLCQMFDWLKQTKLTVNLSNGEFCQAKVTYLGHVVGRGEPTWTLAASCPLFTS